MGREHSAPSASPRGTDFSRLTLRRPFGSLRAGFATQDDGRIRPVVADPHFARARTLDEIERVYPKQLARRAAVGASVARERIDKLRRLRDVFFARRAEIHAALWEDYRKPAPEVDLSEIYPAVGEAKHAIRHLRRWMKPRRVATPLALLGSRSRIVYEPKGLVLIISPWNFPVNLTFGPLVSAIAAGNCAIVKPRR